METSTYLTTSVGNSNAREHSLAGFGSAFQEKIPKNSLLPILWFRQSNYKTTFDKGVNLLEFEKDLLFIQPKVFRVFPTCPAAAAGLTPAVPCRFPGEGRWSPANPSAPDSAFLLPPSGHGELREHGLVRRGMAPTGKECGELRTDRQTDIPPDFEFQGPEPA